MSGRIIGFSISVADFDVEPRVHRIFYMLSIGATFKYAQLFVDGVLLEADPDSSPTAVQTTTWADIKASFAR